MNKLKLNKLVAVLFPVVLILLVIWAAPRSTPLKADSEVFEELVQAKVNGKSISAEGVEVTEKEATLELSSKESCWVKIPKVENIVLTQTNDAGQEISIKEIAEDKFNFSEQETNTNETGDSVEESSEPLSVSTSEAIQLVKNDGAIGDIYVQLQENQNLVLTIHHEGKAEATVQIQDPKDDTRKQQVVSFNSTAKADKTNSDSSGATNDSKNSSETVENAEQTKDGKTILQAVTKPTNKSLKELAKTDFKPEDSLVSPFLLTSSELSATSDTSSDIVAVKGSVEVLDGKAQWDSDNNPGHDENNSNGIVRSWDQVTYLVSFAIQNTNTEVKYQNIKYQVIGTLPNAVQLASDGKTPQVNAMIANGTTYNNSDNQPNPNATEGYSEGIAESTIPNSGQVVAPVIVNVMGAPNGQTLKPTFKLKVISAEKVNENGTVEEVSFNNEYDSTDFPTFGDSETKVSSKPSVGVKLVNGQNYRGAEADSIWETNQTTDDFAAMNIAAVEVLQPLSEHASWASPYVGSGFPTTKVSYSIKAKGKYVNSANQSVDFALTDGDGLTVQAYAPAVYGRTESWKRATTSGPYTVPNFTPDSLTEPLQAPNAITKEVWSNQPPSGTAKNTIGVYNSGDFEVDLTGTNNLGAVSNVTNTNFSGVYNPYTYDMTGGISQFLGNKPFSTMEAVVRFDGTKAYDQVTAAGGNQYTVSLYVDQVTADGVTQKNSTQLDYTHIWKSPGYYDAGVRIWSLGAYPVNSWEANFAGGETLRDTGNVKSLSLSLPNNTEMMRNSGDNYINPGSTVYATRSTISTYGWLPNWQGYDGIIQWNPSALQYNPKELFAGGWLFSSGKSNTILLGKAKDLSQTAPYTSKNLDYETTYDQYTWYTPQEVREGKVSLKELSAIQNSRRYGNVENTQNPQQVGYMFGVPLTVIQTQKGATTPDGHPLIVTSTSREVDQSGKEIFDPIHDSSRLDSSKLVNNSPENPNTVGVYIPPTFPSNYGPGNSTIDLNGQYYWQPNGDAAYVADFGISTKTEVKEPLYEIDEPIDIKVQGFLNGANSLKYDGAIKTTLPIGINYTPGSAVDGQGKPLPDPVITTTGSGDTLQQVLTWSISSTDSDVAIPNIDMSAGSGLGEINFKAESNLYLLNKKPGFSAEGQTKSSLVVNTIGTMWEKGNTTNKDDSPDAARSSSDEFNEKLDQQVPFVKTGDKKVIDVGNVDPAQNDAESMNDITYELTSMYNAVPQNDNALKATINMLDVLPYNGDGRGTKLTGGYTVQSVEVSLTDSQGNDLTSGSSTVTMAYSDKAPGTTYTVTSDPNTISGFVETSNIPEDAKAILFKATDVPVGAIVKATVVLRPNNKQKASDIFVNSANMNSNLDKMVTSEYVKTKVYGRDLAGVAWYDDNSDGLIGKLANGNAEAFAPSIPVKLYRTSLDDENYKNELVKESLTGEKFVDDSGNSLIKTDANGKYLFSNLAEGEYIAEFVVGDQVVQKKFSVTKPLVGDDPTLNSKADQDTFKTDKYTQPKLSDLAADQNLTNATHHVTDVNIGLVRTSTVRLFKYEAGSATDANSNGSLSDTEKSTGTPLAGATFDLYKGNDQTEKIGTATTDANGYLNFTGLALGDYNLVEIKAPEGYELMKTPIKVSITEGNQTVMVYQDNEKTTELPHAGGNGPMVWLLGIASALGLAGLGALYHYYRHPGKKGA